MCGGVGGGGVGEWGGGGVEGRGGGGVGGWGGGGGPTLNVYLSATQPQNMPDTALRAEAHEPTMEKKRSSEMNVCPYACKRNTMVTACQPSQSQGHVTKKKKKKRPIVVVAS